MKDGQANAGPPHARDYYDFVSHEIVVDGEHRGSDQAGQPAASLAGPGLPHVAGPGLPRVADRATFQAELDKLRAREKAHTREGAIRAYGVRGNAPAPRSSPGSRPIAQWSRLEAGRSDDLGGNR